MVIVGIYHSFEGVCNKIIYVHCFCRTLMYLLLHLACLTILSDKTGMTCYNLAVVWAPNILRRKKYKASAEAIQQDTSAEIAVTEFLICNVFIIFYDFVPPTGNLPPKRNAFCWISFRFCLELYSWNNYSTNLREWYEHYLEDWWHCFNYQHSIL
jgi:hypothetical protein